MPGDGPAAPGPVLTERAIPVALREADNPVQPWRAGRPTWPDRALATVVAVGLPPAAAALLDLTGGALASLLLYYGAASVALPLWRRGSLGYGRPRRWPWPVFAPALALPLLLAAIDLGDGGPRPFDIGVWITLLAWAPLNGALEHLVWFFVFDAWRDGWTAGGGRPRLAATVVGSALMLALVGAIHALFWARVLPVGSGGAAAVGVALNALVLLAYVQLRDRSGSQWPVFALHALVDAQLVLVAGYSILPDL